MSELDEARRSYCKAADERNAAEEYAGLLWEALKECSDDLAEWIANHYNLLHYPQEKLRYDREMEPVLRARALLNER